jgi:hypothetical protein
LRLPAELRLEIYRLLLTGNTIHIEDIADLRQNKPPGTSKLFIVGNMCTVNDAMQSLSHLTGASHSQDQSSAISQGAQIPCRSNHIFGKPQCNEPVRLDVQLFRVCRQIYDEAMLLPYAENHFIVSPGFGGDFRETFVS